MQAATSETKSKSLDLSICVHHYTLRAPCPQGQGTVAKEFQIGLCGVVEADLELFCNCWSAGFLGERLYVSQLHPSSQSLAIHSSFTLHRQMPRVG